MYYSVLTQLRQQIGNIETWLDKAEHHAKSHGTNIDELMSGRLVPDMGNFIYQVQSACDYMKGGAAWLSGQKPPIHPDNEQTILEIRERIEKTLSFVDSISEAGYADSGQRDVLVSWSPPETMIGGKDYLLQVVMPNVYFHVSMAYAILRHSGVDIGKMDFLGQIRWKNR